MEKRLLAVFFYALSGRIKTDESWFCGTFRVIIQLRMAGREGYDGKDKYAYQTHHY